MTLPDRRTVDSLNLLVGIIEERILSAESRTVIIVFTPSAELVAQQLGARLPDCNFMSVDAEPAVDDFQKIERFSDLRPGIAIGIGGGKALDAAKVVALWGSAFESCEGLREVLRREEPIERRKASLVMVPTLASSGSESSKGAILTDGARRTGLRGNALQSDIVAQFPEAWSTLPLRTALFHGYDIFAHATETCLNRRCTEQTEIWAGRSMRAFNRWLFTSDANMRQYSLAMEASYFGGLCLGSAGTCLPHRIQYVLGPRTGTSHVEGIFHLAEAWFDILSEKCSARLVNLGRLFAISDHGFADFTAYFRAVRQRCKSGYDPKKFSLSVSEISDLARNVSGALADDPCYEDTSTVEKILRSACLKDD